MGDDVDEVDSDDDKASRVVAERPLCAGRYGSVFWLGSGVGKVERWALQPTKRVAVCLGGPRSVRHGLTNWRCGLK